MSRPCANVTGYFNKFSECQDPAQM